MFAEMKRQSEEQKGRIQRGTRTVITSPEAGRPGYSYTDSETGSLLAIEEFERRYNALVFGEETRESGVVLLAPRTSRDETMEGEEGDESRVEGKDVVVVDPDRLSVAEEEESIIDAPRSTEVVVGAIDVEHNARQSPTAFEEESTAEAVPLVVSAASQPGLDKREAMAREKMERALKEAEEELHRTFDAALKLYVERKRVAKEVMNREMAGRGR